MKLYHLDRAGTLDVSKDIELMKPPYGANWETLQNSHFLDSFPAGLSKHGLHYLEFVQRQVSPQNINMFLKIQTNFISDILSEESNKILEYEYELVRQLHFPNCPSRFTSLFTVKSPSEFENWEQFKNIENPKIVEITVSEDLPRFDANLLHGGITFGLNPNEIFFRAWTCSLL